MCVRKNYLANPRLSPKLNPHTFALMAPHKELAASWRQFIWWGLGFRKPRLRVLLWEQGCKKYHIIYLTREIQQSLMCTSAVVTTTARQILKCNWQTEGPMTESRLERMRPHKYAFFLAGE